MADKKEKDIRKEMQSDDTGRRINDYLTKLENNRSTLGEIYTEMNDIETCYANEQDVIENRPNTRVNVLHANIEGQVASMVEQNISIACRGEGPSDDPFAEWGRIGLDWTLRKNRIKKILDAYARRWEKFGWAWLGLCWDADAVKGFGIAKIYPIPNQNFFIDKKISDPLRYQDAEYMAEVCLQSKSWAKQQERYKGRAEDISYGGTDKAIIFQKEKETDDEDSFWLIKWWSKPDGILRYEEFSDDGILLYDSFEDDDYKGKDGEYKPYYRYNKYPYFLSTMYPMEGRLYGFGDGKLLVPLQNMLNDLYDQIRRAARPNRIFFDEQSEVDLEELDNDDGPIPCQEPNQTIRVVEVGRVNPALWQLINNIHTETQRVTRFSELMLGQSAGSKTATEAAIQQQQGNSAIDHKKMILQETLVEMCEYALDMMMEHYTEGKAFRIDENKEDYAWIDFRQLNTVPVLMPATEGYMQKYRSNNPDSEVPQWQQVDGETKSVDFDIEISIGAGLPNNKAFLWQMADSLSRAVIDGRSAITWEEFREFCRKFLGIPLQNSGQLKEQQPQEPSQPIDAGMQSPPSTSGIPVPMEGDIPGMSPAGNPVGTALPPRPQTPMEAML